ncbi:LEA type 2 family protein [Thermococcus camini]|uniref:Water stress and hypersensitive response domain-containing protein n=1 Tax=Thermococcus camini TaxID=2016373 RepID=A0A7G2D9R0_9EURY|nr:LEA type 2 family protein [Thermococcus camini]CAD5245289.1 conserved protein of unknown function [Thermococcus camini]
MKLRYIILGLALIFIIWVGYVAYAAYTLSPRVSSQWGYVDEKTTEIWIDARLSKPLLVPVSIKNLTVVFSGIPVMRIERFKYEPTKTEVSLVIGVDNRNLVRGLISYLESEQRGEVDIILNGTFLKAIPINLDLKKGISENILAYLNFTADSKEIAGGLIKSPAVVETTFDWGGEKNGKAVLVAHMKLYNPNRFPVPVTKLSFQAYANSIKIGEGETSKKTVIPAKGYATIDVRMYINEDSLPKVWEIHIRNGEASRVTADIFLRVNLMGNPYDIKLASYEEIVRTHIIEDLNNLLNQMLG